MPKGNGGIIGVANDPISELVTRFTSNGTFTSRPTTSNAGATLFHADVPSGDVINFNFPEDGIVFPKGIFCKTKTKVAAYTLLTDKFSGKGLTV